MFSWRPNGVKMLAYDKTAETILVKADLLMDAIQRANPGQQLRKIRLVNGKEWQEYQNKKREAANEYTADTTTP